MRLLLDECVARTLKRDLVGHEAATVVEAGYRGMKNGVLLRAASGNYDVFITVDRNLPFQQNIGSLQIAVLLLLADGITYDDLKNLFPNFWLRSVQSSRVNFYGLKRAQRPKPKDPRPLLPHEPGPRTPPLNQELCPLCRISIAA